MSGPRPYMADNYTKILEWESAKNFKVGDIVELKSNHNYIYEITSIEVLRIGVQVGPDDEKDVKPALIYGLFVDLLYSPNGMKIYNWINPCQVQHCSLNKESLNILYKK